MALSHSIHAYLALERAAVDLDAASDPLADTLRDRMDHIWYGLTSEEREWLDRRSGPAERFAGTLPSDGLAAAPETKGLILLPSVLRVIDAPA